MMRALTLLALLAAGGVVGEALATSLSYDRRDNPFDIFALFASHRMGVLATSTPVPGPLNANTRAIMITCSVACRVAQAASPATATADSYLLPANVILRLAVRPNMGGFAIIRDSSDGNASIGELQ